MITDTQRKQHRVGAPESAGGPGRDRTKPVVAPVLRVRRLTPRIGAEIDGVDLSSDLTDAEFDTIYKALLAHRVVFFRGQHQLNRDGQERFARRFGPLTAAHPTIPAVAGVPPMLRLDSLSGGQADEWHTDVTFIDRPPDISVLRGVVIPEVGGDTLWASTVAAYASLQPSLQRLADSLRAVHTNRYDYARTSVETLAQELSPARAEYLRQFVSTVYETEHPVVRVHPETGERALLLGSFAQRVVGYPTGTSADLLRLLQQAVTKPENFVRWRWQAGDVVVWDNRATQHYATFDYGDVHRRVERVTTVGSVPVGTDGRTSRSLVGDASAYNAEAEAA